MATAVWVRRTVPLVMVWTGLFVLLPAARPSCWSDGQRLDPTWRLIDLWNNLYLVGLWCLGADHGDGPPAAAAAGAGRRRWSWRRCARRAWLYLRRRVQAVEIVS